MVLIKAAAVYTTPLVWGDPPVIVCVSFISLLLLVVDNFLYFAENKLQQKSRINLQNKKKKARHKKITGFQVKISVRFGIFANRY